MKRSILSIMLLVAAAAIISFMTTDSKAINYSSTEFYNVNKINSDSSGFTVDSAGDVAVDAEGSVTVTSDEVVYVQGVSGAAGTDLQAVKSVFGTVNATEAGATVTLAEGAVFTDIGSYTVFTTSTSTVAVSATAENIDGENFVVTGGEGVEIKWFAIGN